MHECVICKKRPKRFHRKKTLVDKKQVFRLKDSGRFMKDLIALRNEKIDGEPLLKAVMKKGKLFDDD